MGDKDKPFSFEGIKLGVLDGDGFKELPIEENSLVAFQNEEQTTDENTYTAGSFSFDLDNASIDKAVSSLLFGTDMRQDTNNVRSVIIQSGGYINRPKNLKYPNKKRARRIWNKWRNRYGVRPSKQIVIPKARIIPSMNFKNLQLMCDVQITTEKTSQ